MSYRHASDDDDGRDTPDMQPTPSREVGTMTHQSRSRARWILHVQAVVWRFLMGLGMMFHRMAPPRPPKPAFQRTVRSTISGKPGSLTLHFYTPMDYGTQQRLWTSRKPEERLAAAVEEEEGSEGSGSGSGKGRRKNGMSLTEMGRNLRRRSNSAKRWGSYPVMINFHGGGFTLGSALDDARWCGTVVDECNAVVVSVDYRLAPECPFPTAVEDGVDAVLYVHRHAEELGIDKDKIALSGFSSGANMACTVPLRLYDEIMGFPRDDNISRPPTAKEKVERAINGVSSRLRKTKSGSGDSTASSSTRVAPEASNTEVLDPNEPPPPTPDKRLKKDQTRESVIEHESLPDISIRCIIPWYPSLDYTRTREQRRATCKRKDQELPALFTNLFDDSYLHPPNTISLDSPYLSPGVAPTSLLRAALPEEIILHTCEWDMLLDEGEAFRDRISGPEIGKNVWYRMVEGVPHGWDKAPNPWKPTPGVREHYLRACKEMRRVFGGAKEGGRPVVERQTTRGWPTTAPTASVSVVR